MVKIVPEADAKQQGGAVGAGRSAPAATGWSRRSITLRYESAAQLVNVLRPLITPNNTIAAFPGSNALVITDYADNLRRIDRIIASLDQPPGGEPIVVPLQLRVGDRRRAAAQPAARPSRPRPGRPGRPTRSSA